MGWHQGCGHRGLGRLRVPCGSPRQVAPQPCPGKGGTYTLPPVHGADAAEGVPVVDASLQASLRRDVPPSGPRLTWFMAPPPQRCRLVVPRPRRGTALPQVTQPVRTAGFLSPPGPLSVLYPRCLLQSHPELGEWSRSAPGLREAQKPVCCCTMMFK